MRRPIASLRLRCSVLFVVAVVGATAAAVPASAGATPLLPLARGQIVVSLGTPPQWLPLSGTPQTLTVFAGRPRAARGAGALNAYLVLQRAGLRCAANARRAHGVITVPHLYAASRLLADGASPFAPNGGTAPGDVSASVSGVVVRQQGAVRVCVWLATRLRAGGHTLAASLTLPLLNRTFAASVTALPQYDGGRLTSGGGYTVDAISGGTGIGFVARTTQCGVTSTDRQSAGAGATASETIALPAHPCAGDGTAFRFARAGGAGLGSLTFTVADAQASPPALVTLGACELDPVAGTSLPDARAYISADGCRVGRVLTSPYASGISRGAVLGASVDGGVASLAPLGTAVDVVVNG